MDFSVFDDYECDGQFSLFDYTRPTFKIDKPVRLIETFGGIGSQSMALERLGVNFEHYRLIEFDKYPVASYNAIHGTNFEPMDITKVKGFDLGIVDCDKYTYLLTYSFPCTDLSVAGKMQGMSKADWENGNSTRSGLLWEVERLLNEVENLPQVLVMENVTQVHSETKPKLKDENGNLLKDENGNQLYGESNFENFRKWLDFLESKGYSNFYQDMNAKNYGVAQNRDRTIMVSILGEWNFKFPSEIPLKKVMKDHLEDEVDKNYYITSEKAQTMVEKLILDGKILEQSRAEQSEPKIGFAGNMRGQNQGFVGSVYYTDGICPGLRARDYKEPIEVLECKSLSMDQKKILKVKVRQATKKGYVEVELPGAVDMCYPSSTTRRGRVQDGGGEFALL